LKAIELNGEAVEMNTQAFVWGRRAAADPAAADAFVTPLRKPTASREISQTLDEIVARRVAFLTDYQNAAYGERYRLLVRRVADAERARVIGEERARRGRSALLLQAHGLQGRIRGRAALYGRQLCQAGRRDLRRRYADGSASRAADPRAQGR
jgi:hypothetical protein